MKKLKVTTSFDEMYCRSAIKIQYKDAELVFVDGEPEDSNLSRDFSDAYAIANFVKKVSEDVEIETVDVDWSDF